MVLSVGKVKLLGAELTNLLLVISGFANRFEYHGESIEIFCVFCVFWRYDSALDLFSEFLGLELEVVWNEHGVGFDFSRRLAESHGLLFLGHGIGIGQASCSAGANCRPMGGAWLAEF